MIVVDASSIERAQKLLQELPGAAEKVANTAIRKSMKGARADAVKQVASRYLVTQTEIRKTIDVRVSRMAAKLASTGHVAKLHKYRTKPSTAKGQISFTKRKEYIYANVVKGEGGTIAHAFVAQMASGHTGVFQRRPDRSLQELYGPSIPQAMTRPEVSDLIIKGIEERLATNVDREVNAFLMGYRR